MNLQKQRTLHLGVDWKNGELTVKNHCNHWLTINLIATHVIFCSWFISFNSRKRALAWKQRDTYCDKISTCCLSVYLLQTTSYSSPVSWRLFSWSGTHKCLLDMALVFVFEGICVIAFPFPWLRLWVHGCSQSWKYIYSSLRSCKHMP